MTKLPLLVIDDELRSCIHRNAPESEMRNSAAKAGMVTMREDGQRWVHAGVTSLDEVIRVTRD